MIMTHTKNAGSRLGLPGAVSLLPADGEYHVTCASDPSAIQAALTNHEADFVLVGVILPARSGTELCRLLRTTEGQMQYPVALLRASSPSMATGDRLAARPSDTALTHFSSGPRDPEIISAQDMHIHKGRHEVRINEQTIDLTATEFRLLCLFAENPGWVHARDQIIEHIRGKGYSCTPRSVDVLIVGLRKKLGALGKRIQTVRGVGYRYRE